VDLLERIVRLNPGETKNEEGRIIALAPELYEVLKIHKQARDEFWPTCPWVFHRFGERVRNFRKAWATACKEAGAGLWDAAAGKLDAQGKPQGKHARVFHDLRRSGVRNLIRAGVPERVAMQISGHKTRSILDRYNIVSERDLKDAALRLGEYLGAKSGPNSGTQFSTNSRHEPKAPAVQ
jgi:hypothetical protein